MAKVDADVWTCLLPAFSPHDPETQELAAAEGLGCRMSGKQCEKCGGRTLHLGCGKHYCDQCDHETRESILCQNCGKREATENWVGDGGTMAFVHGMYQCWCRICCLEEQLKHMREAAARIPATEAELAELAAAERGLNR